MGIKQFEPNIFDYDYTGAIDTKGQITQVWGKDALDQSIKLWIASFRGEVIRKPAKGGFLIPWLLKPMREVSIEDIEMTIKDGIDQDFTPYLKIISLKIEPNYEKRYWDMRLKVFSSDLRVQTTVNEKIKGRLT